MGPLGKMVLNSEPERYRREEGREGGREGERERERESEREPRDVKTEQANGSGLLRFVGSFLRDTSYPWLMSSMAVHALKSAAVQIHQLC